MLPMYYPMQAQIDAASRHANRYLRDKAFDVAREISIGGETLDEGRDDSSDGLQARCIQPLPQVGGFFRPTLLSELLHSQETHF